MEELGLSEGATLASPDDDDRASSAREPRSNHSTPSSASTVSSVPGSNTVHCSPNLSRINSSICLVAQTQFIKIVQPKQNSSPSRLTNVDRLRVSETLLLEVRRKEEPRGSRFLFLCELSARLEPMVGHGTQRSPAGEVVQVEVQRGSGVPATDIFRPPCYHHLSSSLSFLVVLDAPSRRRGSFLPPTVSTDRYILLQTLHASGLHSIILLKCSAVKLTNA